MMMPDRGQSPADQWYYKQPTDRTAISQQKIDQLQVCLVFRPKYRFHDWPIKIDAKRF